MLKDCLFPGSPEKGDWCFMTSVPFCPSIGIFYRFVPSFDAGGTVFFADGRSKSAVDCPVLDHFVLVLPITDGKPCQICLLYTSDAADEL